jgi:hypothetical protein
MGLSLLVQRRIAIGFVIFGLALLLYMILFEDEPGAVPLALIVGGSVWIWLLKRM